MKYPDWEYFKDDKLIINKKYYTTYSKSLRGTYKLIISTKLFKFRWFTDCGHWFLYIHLGKKWCRFSDQGYMSGEVNFEDE